jgi:hypothetical protein
MQKIPPHRKASILTMLEELWKIVDGMTPETRCRDCQYFGNGGVCRMADNQMIPKDVLATGCPEWKFNQKSAPF